MRYLAQRVGTGEWIDRDLPLSNVDRTRELDGPGVINATVDPELRQMFHTDGLRVLEDWGTLLYACDDDTGRIQSAGIVAPPTAHDETAQTISAIGFAGYPQGYIRTESTPAYIQVDPITMAIAQWEWMQDQPQSDLGVTIVGDLTTNGRVKIGDNEEPYRLRFVEAPDLGAEIDNLAGSTPFNYVEEHEWANSAMQVVNHRIRIGYPRLGRQRSDLRFALGENIVSTVTAGTAEEYANDVLGIGNGDGAAMVWDRVSVNDGRLRRTKVLTDKTIKNKTVMKDRLRNHLARLSPTLDISEVQIVNHYNAAISAIALGDDIFVQTEIPTYGDVAMWVRVLSITVNDEDPSYAALGTQRSSAFLYNPSESVT